MFVAGPLQANANEWTFLWMSAWEKDWAGEIHIHLKPLTLACRESPSASWYVYSYNYNEIIWFSLQLDFSTAEDDSAQSQRPEREPSAEVAVARTLKQQLCQPQSSQACLVPLCIIVLRNCHETYHNKRYGWFQSCGAKNTCCSDLFLKVIIENFLIFTFVFFKNYKFCVFYTITLFLEFESIVHLILWHHWIPEVVLMLGISNT